MRLSVMVLASEMAVRALQPEMGLIGSPACTQSAQDRARHNSQSDTSIVLSCSYGQHFLNFMCRQAAGTREKMAGLECIAPPVAEMGPRLRDS